VLDTADGFRRFVEITPSKYHGILLCQGTLSESLKNPATEILDVIRYFGSRARSSRSTSATSGGFLDFWRSVPDNGDVDMLRGAAVYKEVGYVTDVDAGSRPHIEETRAQAGVRLRARISKL
jgi:mannonate dehydratase